MTSGRATPRDTRLLLALCQATTILVSWPLWGPRALPPTLSVLPLPIPFGVALLATLAVFVARPVLGATLHVVVLGLALVSDETRMQPAILSTALCLVASTGRDRAWLGRAHLATQWAWAGLSKLVSPAFWGVLAPAIAGVLPAWVPFREHVAAIGALLELGLGLAALDPRLWPFVARAGAVFHALVLAGLVAWSVNEGAWAWNLGIAVASLAFFGEPRGAPLSPRPRAAVAALALAPCLFFVGALHPALAHQLYTGTAPTTLTCDAAGVCSSDRELRGTLEAFGVPIPGRPTLLRRYFLATCTPGDRWLARSRVPGRGYGAIVAVARCGDLESSDLLGTAPSSGLNTLALSSYPGGHAAPGGAAWERP